ncbi:hypothetical protein HOD05_02925 [Candidatus Woesearchaeota archaeon]|jgi:lactate dehydrogenase-like 2-hydroxyacid dehydrogenase|nr:hypothetical protein [Candidatus Woesearchaeota archaeon]MBT4151326.1 hypothetical protein [Candidatus Woesearchaeota archaeon]MBT4247437.1 hypothetical protein [Candidatus Woesearchaeota archaeon]MBT4434148.1 hypothetical protein [Candidatus Woesearchaeota archaeon]
MEKFKKVVALDTIIFYPEHEEVLKQLVEKPKIERVPLVFDQQTHEWNLPVNYKLPEDANIVIWPSSLPTSFDGITTETHQKLKTAQCWTEAGLRDNVSAQNLYNRLQGADCILTCWTEIPDQVLDKLIVDEETKAIITWTHEFEHRLNVNKTRKAGIHTNCVPDYGTDAVAELEFDGLIKLIERNKSTDEKWKTDEDVTIGVVGRLFDHYRKSHINEKKTRRGQFSHQFHKIGRSLKHYGDFGERSIDEIIPEKLIEGKSIGIIGDQSCDYLENVLNKGFKMNVRRQSKKDEDSAEFYKFIAENETIVYDSSKVSPTTSSKIRSIKGGLAIDVSELKHYNETLRGKKLGIVGLGRIGSRVAEIAEAFEMDIQYTGTSKKQVSHEFVDIDELMTSSDIVSVNVKAHVAKGMISQDRINAMQEGTYFINTSDANAVDQEALTKRMLGNQVYAALDVYQGLPTTQTLCLDDNINGKVKNQLANHVLWYRAGWKTQESIRVKTYKLLGHMMAALDKN